MRKKSTPAIRWDACPHLTAFFRAEVRSMILSNGQYYSDVHNGVDYVGADGTPIHAYRAGEVVFAGVYSDGATAVIIKARQRNVLLLLAPTSWIYNSSDRSTCGSRRRYRSSRCYRNGYRKSSTLWLVHWVVVWLR